jgi:hypothetical protein
MVVDDVESKCLNLSLGFELGFSFHHLHMSRHRDIRNLNIQGLDPPRIYLDSSMTQHIDHLDDDALSDGGEDELTEEQQGASLARAIHHL